MLLVLRARDLARQAQLVLVLGLVLLLDSAPVPLVVALSRLTLLQVRLSRRLRALALLAPVWAAARRRYSAALDCLVVPRQRRCTPLGLVLVLAA